MAFFEERRIKDELLKKYVKLPSVIANNEPCFAISCDWYAYFHFPVF